MAGQPYTPDVGRRGWGRGSLYRHAVIVNGKRRVYYRVAINLGTDPFGKRIRREWQRRTKEEATRVLEENLRRLRVGLPLEEGRVTLGVYGAAWLEGMRPNVRPTTWSFYDVLVRLHLADLAYVDLNRLTAGMVRELVATRVKEGYASRTVRGVVGVLSMILRQAMREGLIVMNVTEGIRLPKFTERPARPFTTEEAYHFLEAVKGDWLESLFVTAIGTGLRRGELVGLSWSDVDLEAGVVHVRQAKTARGVRTIPMPPFVIEALREHGRGVGPIWKVTEDAVTRHFRLLCQRVGLPRVRFHDLRHTTATLLLAEGVDPLVIQSILGHTSLAVTARYAHVVSESQVEAMRRLGARLAGQSAGHPDEEASRETNG